MKLEEIEALRQELVQKIMEITGLTADDFDVNISFSSDNDLIVEAQKLEWYKIEYGDSIWYTSIKPSGGEVTVFEGDDK
jgi:hypothetical protein